MLGQTAQFAQQVGPAQRVFRRELEIRSPGVVHREALELWQDVYGLQRGETPLGMVAIQRELRAAHHMHPLQLAVHLAARPPLGVRSGQEAAGLVSVQNGLPNEVSVELCFEIDRAISSHMEVQDNDAVAGTRSAERFEDLCGAFEGHEVCRVQVDRQSMHPRSVLHLSRDVIWKRCLLAVPTPWANLDVRAVLGHLQPHLWQVHDLPCHLPLGMDALLRVSTGAVSGQRSGDDLIDMLRHLEGLADMTTLSARRPADLLALTLWYPEFIFARWLTGGRAVLRLPCFEGLKPSEKLSHLRFEFADACFETLTVGTGTSLMSYCS